MNSVSLWWRHAISTLFYTSWPIKSLLWINLNAESIIVGLHQPRPPDKIFYKFNEQNCKCLQ